MLNNRLEFTLIRKLNNSFNFEILGNERLVKELIENGADVDYKSRDGYTALHYASIRGKVEISSNWNIFCLVGSWISDSDFVKNSGFWKSIQNSGCKKNYWKQCVFRWFFSGHEKTVEELIENGANVNIKGAYGRTPIFSAITYGNFIFLIADKCN